MFAGTGPPTFAGTGPPMFAGAAVYSSAVDTTSVVTVYSEEDFCFFLHRAVQRQMMMQVPMGMMTQTTRTEAPMIRPNIRPLLKPVKRELHRASY